MESKPIEKNYQKLTDLQPKKVGRGLHEWGFSGLQNQGCRFLQPAEIFTHHAKIFEAHLMNFSKALNVKCCVKK